MAINKSTPIVIPEPNDRYCGQDLHLKNENLHKKHQSLFYGTHKIPRELQRYFLIGFT